MTDIKRLRKTGIVDRTRDIHHLKEQLMELNVFMIKFGRQCPGFPLIEHSTTLENPVKLKLKILKIQRAIANYRGAF